MRIVSGKFRSRKILNVEDDKTRPTTDKNREAIYNLIGPYFHGGTCLDLFSGSGALGIEALSRGMEYCYFCDISNEAIKAIHANLKTLKINDAKVFQRDYKKVLKLLKAEEVKLDLVLLDPPYKMFDIEEMIKLLCDYDIISDDVIIVTETSKETTLKDEIECVIKTKEKVYGITRVCIFGRK